MRPSAIGGAIYNKGILTSTKTIIFGNKAAQYAGGIYNSTSGKITLTGNSILRILHCLAAGCSTAVLPRLMEPHRRTMQPTTRREAV